LVIDTPLFDRARQSAGAEVPAGTLRGDAVFRGTDLEKPRGKSR
jgi:hypothetical protein